MNQHIKLLEDIIQMAPIPIAVLEGYQLKIILANQAMMEAWGKGSQIIGKNYLEVLPEVKNDAFFEEAVGVLKTGIPFHETNKKVNLVIDGISRLHYFNYSFTPLYNENGEVYAVMNTGVDVTDVNFARQKIEKELQHTQELRRSNDDLLHFASIVSHDLREPIRKIKIFEALLRDEKKAVFTDNVKKYLGKIEKSTQRMENIIEGILAYSTIDNTTQQIEKVNLDEVIENIKADLELIIEEKGAVLVISTFPVIEGAPILITQLFYNLIQNALKFSKADVPPRIIISCKTIEYNAVSCVEITIKDNGIGFDEAFSERIFNNFERLHSKDQYEGNGLGLSLCKKIVKRHSGKISVKSQKDDGAEFIVILPLKQLKENI